MFSLSISAPRASKMKEGKYAAKWSEERRKERERDRQRCRLSCFKWRLASESNIVQVWLPPKSEQKLIARSERKHKFDNDARACSLRAPEADVQNRSPPTALTWKFRHGLPAILRSAALKSQGALLPVPFVHREESSHLIYLTTAT